MRLQGVITYADPDWHNCFLQSPGGAIYVDSNQRDVKIGQWVEVTGQTSVGGFAPDVINSNIRILGTTNLPPPVKTDLEDLADGHLDAHWVELEGVVRKVTEEWEHADVSLMTPKGRFSAIMIKAAGQPPPTGLIGALVSVRGACTSEMNSRGQLAGVVLHVTSLEDIRIIEPVPENPFASDSIKISTVAKFDATRLAGRRLKVTGSVTQVISGKGFYVQDASGGIFVNYVQTNDLRSGDTISVLGFPAITDFSPCLEEAVYQRSASSSPPEPEITTAEEILFHGKHDSTLVKVEARLVQPVRRSAHPKLVLQSGSIIFTATMLTDQDPANQSEAARLSQFKSGSVLEVIGICSIQGGEIHEPETFRLLVQSPRNVILLRSPPWWSLQHTLILVASLGLGVLIAWGWSRSLRGQVNAQTEVIRKNQQDMIKVSRQAGMAEVATGVLHNVGNVLNSVNVSVDVIRSQITRSRLVNLSKVTAMLAAHKASLGEYLTSDPKGSRIPEFLSHLAIALEHEHSKIARELKDLHSNVEHIKQIVAMQQSYATVAGMSENLQISELVEDAIRMNEGAFLRHSINVKRTFQTVPAVRVDKHKILQILVNLFRNAKYAMVAANQNEKVLELIISKDSDNNRVQVVVRDNGIGIAPENLTRIFGHGFTTKKDGHGFGLHSGALAAKEMGGSLQAFSDGPGKGATFILALPIAVTTSATLEAPSREK